MLCTKCLTIVDFSLPPKILRTYMINLNFDSVHRPKPAYNTPIPIPSFYFFFLSFSKILKLAFNYVVRFIAIYSFLYFN